MPDLLLQLWAHDPSSYSDSSSRLFCCCCCLFFFLTSSLILSCPMVHPVASMPSVNYESYCSSRCPCSSLVQDNCNSLLTEFSISFLSSRWHPFCIWRQTELLKCKSDNLALSSLTFTGFLARHTELYRSFMFVFSWKWTSYHSPPWSVLIGT